MGQCPIQSSLKNHQQWEVTLRNERADKKLLTDPKIRVTPRVRKKYLSVHDQEVKNTVSAIELVEIKSPPTRYYEIVNDHQFSNMLHMMNTGCSIQNISSREQWYTDLPPIEGWRWQKDWVGGDCHWVVVGIVGLVWGGIKLDGVGWVGFWWRIQNIEWIHNESQCLWPIRRPSFLLNLSNPTRAISSKLIRIVIGAETISFVIASALFWTRLYDLA